MASEGPITNALVRGRLGLDRQEAKNVLRELVDDGTLVLLGERRGSRYELAPQPPLTFDDDDPRSRCISLADQASGEVDADLLDSDRPQLRLLQGGDATDDL